jgi:precorrin-8X/cobalt-precorrin-8 methylmutase
LICFDFPYGYPQAFAQQLPNQAAPLPNWQKVWNYLQNCVHDDLGTSPGRASTNRNNRFIVANNLNHLLSTPQSRGPFWCSDDPAQHNWIPQNQPAQPFVALGGTIRPFRLADRAAQSDFPFRLFGNGSVGSQMIVGIPCLQRLRMEPSLVAVSAVWPFETGWATQGNWLAAHIRIVHAEIYPSVLAALPDTVRDRGQVRAMWEWAKALDSQGILQQRFACPTNVTPGSQDDLTIRTDEGWILQ